MPISLILKKFLTALCDHGFNFFNDITIYLIFKVFISIEKLQERFH